LCKYLSVFLTRCCYTVNVFIYDVSGIYLLTYPYVVVVTTTSCLWRTTTSRRRRHDVVRRRRHDDVTTTSYVHNWF